MSAPIFFRVVIRLTAVGISLVATGSMGAQWKATGPGPFRYDDSANWEGGLINDKITNNPESEQAIQFTTDRTMPEGLLLQQSAPEGGRVFALNFKGRNAE